MILILILIFLFGNVVLTNDEVDDRTKNKPTEMALFSNCFEDIGCIEVTKDWYHPKYRPVNFKPLERNIIKTEFLFITVNEKDLLQLDRLAAKADAISTAGYQKNLDVVIVIHDFTSDGYTGWIKHLASAILSKYPVNLISVDWQAGAEPPFDQAVANARVVALEIIAFIGCLKTLGTGLEDIHLIGHGIGAHIAGYVGMELKDIKKITGLDPTGPRFEYMPDNVRLNPGCAKYVEILHTDHYEDISQGTAQHMGHSDFFINNALVQPGCVETKHKSLLKLGRQNLLPGQILPGCSHKRSFKYFIEAIDNRDCVFVGIRCPSYKHFAQGKCTDCFSYTEEDVCVTFGLSSKHRAGSNSSFYLNTGFESPYCLFTYSVSIILDGDQNYRGYFDMFLKDCDDKIANLSFTDSSNRIQEFKSRSDNTFLYYASHPPLGSIKEARVRWTSKPSRFNLLGRVRKAAIPVKKIVIEPVSRGEVYATSLKSADQVNKEIGNQEYKTFKAYKTTRREEPKAGLQVSKETTTKKSKKNKNQKRGEKP